MGVVYTFNTALIHVALKYVNQLNASVPSRRFSQELKEHPYYPSLLSVSETFRKFGMENEAYRVSREQFANLEIDTPFVAHIKIKDFGNDFVLVTSVTANEVSYIHATGKPIRTTRQDFNQSVKNAIWRVTSAQDMLLRNVYKVEANKEEATAKGEWTFVRACLRFLRE